MSRTEMDGRKTLAAQRGQIYLDFARRYLEKDDTPNAISHAEEGLRLTAGPFYIAVRDQLQDFLESARQ